MKHAQDHFSSIAAQYAKGRIGYPPALYDFLQTHCRAHDLAWDCATGSGQAALDLATRFDRVVATDISRELLALAPAHPRITYRVAPAEASGLGAASVDLIVVAQALHWFELDLFWAESSRVLKPGGVLAFWGYNWAVVDSAVDAVLEEFKAMIASSWPARSAILHGNYNSVHLPAAFIEVTPPVLSASAQWTLENYLAHLRSWSATRYHAERTGEDPVEKFTARFAQVWKGDARAMHWPLVVRAAKKG